MRPPTPPANSPRRLARHVCVQTVQVSGVACPRAAVPSTMSATDSTLPIWRHALELEDAPQASDHGLPLGDGLNGASIWGDGRPLYVSLDRADLWDLRPIEEYHRPDYRWDDVVAAHRAGRHDDLRVLLEAPYDRPGPTRLPAGRLSLGFAGRAVRWRLERATGVAAVSFDDGLGLEAFIDAEGVGRLRVKGGAPEVQVIPPPFAGPPEGWAPRAGPALSRHNAWDLGYPPPDLVRMEGLSGFRQSGWGGFKFTTVIGWRQEAGDWRAAWIVLAGDKDAGALWQDATSRLEQALAADFDDDAARQAAWWSDYWSRSRLSVPDAGLERLYYSGMHQFGAAARRGGPPASLQGVWTSDDDALPPWKGDYHHDLNTQMTYWPAYAGDQLEAGLGFLDWLWATREICLEWTRRFYGVAGLNVPMTADIQNRQIGGWRQYTHSVSTGAWLAHHFYLHWRYSQDRWFLTERALPYLTEVCRFVEAISEARDARGLRSVALSSSPEVGDNRPEAWFAEFTNYDLSLFRWVLGAAAELADDAGLPEEAGRWREVLNEMPELAVSEVGELLIAPGLAYPDHHRHMSHAVAVHPLVAITGFDPDPSTRRVAAATVRQVLAARGDWWMGYSHAWAAALAARIGDGDAAGEALTKFGAAFVFPNGFHANGDWRGKGIGKARFGAFTLEGAMGASDAVQTMLLQSAPGRIRLFPAVPKTWREASFEGLLADGGIKVSAALVARRITQVELVARTGIRLTVAGFDRDASIDVALEPGERLILGRSALDGLNTQDPK